MNTNPRLAARLSVEKKYLASNPELNTTAIGNLNYLPSVLGGKAAVESAAHEMKRAGMLSASTDVEELAKKAFVHLEGVNDGWVEGLQIAQLPGGRVPEDQPMRLAAELATQGTPEQGRDVLRAGFARRAAAGPGLEMHGRDCAVNGSTELLDSPPRATAPATVAPVAGEIPRGAKLPWRTLLAVPIATALAFGLHLLVSQNELPLETRYYSIFLAGFFGASVLAAVVQPWWAGLRAWMRDMCPILAATVALLAVWETITSGLRWLPMPYFPSPAGVLLNLIDDRAVVFDSTWHSLILLVGGYALGVFTGLITGVCIGWFKHARYWGMPVLKVVGPIPATAWIPLAMVVSPNATFSAIGLIALAVWFPVTMLTASGISNTRASYLDVARTLGASRALSHLPRRDSRRDAEHFHRPLHGPRRVVPHARRRRNRRREIRPRLVCAVGAGLGGIRQGLCRARRHGRVLFHDHDAALQSARPRARLAKRNDQVVAVAATRRLLAARPRGEQEFSRARTIRSPRRLALDAVSLSVAAGELVSLVGPSGCGKSTLLRLIAGLDLPDSGELLVGSEPITARARSAASSSRIRIFSRGSPCAATSRPASSRAASCARSGMRWTNSCASSASKDLPDAYPHHLSGGMAQRVALARALINHPKVLLLDEPLGALDAFTRMRMQDEVLRLWQARRTTMLLVTHDIDEAIYMSDRIVIMTQRPGRIERIIPIELDRPRDRSSAEFLRLRAKFWNCSISPATRWRRAEIVEALKS